MNKEKKVQITAEHYRARASNYYTFSAGYATLMGVTLAFIGFTFSNEQMQFSLILGLIGFIFASLGFVIFWYKANNFKKLEKKELEKIIGKIKG